MDIRFKPYTPTPILRGHMRMGDEHIQINSQYIERDGKPVIPVMGEYHFVRDSRSAWPRELAKMKAGGVNIIATYMLWIYHEEIEGAFDFTGDRDIRAFILESRKQGLEVMLRIGPWAHGECRNGGFPDWLMESGIPLRTNDPRYMEKARIWYERIYDQVKGLFKKDGGPIIGIQFENELVDNAGHLLALKHLALEIGYDAPIYTVTGWNSKYGARIPVNEVLPVFAAYVDAPWDESLKALPPSHHFSFDPTRNDTAVGMDLMRDTDADGWRLPYERYPFATCELGSGLQVTHHRRPIVSAMDAYALSLVKLGCGSNLIGYYMFHGGTNKLGKMSTLQESRASGYPNDVPILNYDFQTCLSQYGEARDQYGMLNMLHLFAEDFGHMLAPMEHVPAENFVPCTDTKNLRCALRTDGKSGFVFVCHHQRSLNLENVRGAVIHAPDVTFPPIDVCGSIAFFMPVHMALDSAHLRCATAQPLCRAGNTFFFAAIDGVEPEFFFDSSEGEKRMTAKPGFNSGFDVGDVRIITLTFDQARFLRRISGEIFVGDRCNLYALNGEIAAIEDGSFSYWRYAEDHFERVSVQRDFHPAVLALDPADKPFAPPYAEEMHLNGERALTWQRMHVTTPEGFVTIAKKYDAAQIYADGKLVADNFYTGIDWRVPAALIYARECYLVTSELRHDFYGEYPGARQSAGTYTPFYREIRPEGWLRRQLEIQAQGLSGHLHEVWPDVRDSAWIGGSCEGWERVPYWLDGLIPLAHLLGDAQLIDTANRYVHSIIARQQEDGWICPCSKEERAGYDAWAVLLIGKVLALHVEFTDDPKAEQALYRAMKNLYELLKNGEIRLFDWGRFRWYEGFVPLIHLYQRRAEYWMLDLARMLRAQGADYEQLADLWKRPMNKWTFETHIVNLCMMLKYEAVCCALLGEKYTGKAEKLLSILEAYNGTAVGTLTGDECLSGIANNQGTELCAVVELMYAYEWLYAVTGDGKWADRLEKAAFNALPATFTDDMWAHQYDQQVNQIACAAFPGKSFFRTNDSEAHLFGLEPHYGCCTANFSQGWPKLALSALQKTERGAVIAHLLPVSASIQLGGKPVSIRIESDYPFRLGARITVSVQDAAEFELAIRVPAWAKDVRLNGKRVRIRSGHISLARSWKGESMLQLSMCDMPRMLRRPGNLRSVEYGALVFSLPIETQYRMKEYTRNDVERKFPYCDYELIPQSPWNYGFAGKGLSVHEQPIGDIPFSSKEPPLIIEADMAQIPWDYADGYDSVAAALPSGRKPIAPPERRQLIPYGCAKLRMTEMPAVRK